MTSAAGPRSSPKGNDLTPPDADVAGERVAGVGDAPAADDGVELAHASPIPPDISAFAPPLPPPTTKAVPSS